MGFIYCITNTITGKKYIGLTTRTIKHRFSRHVSASKGKRKSCSALYGSFNKYGVDNFTIESVIEESDPIKLMNLEQYYIKKMNTLSPNGYNLTTGGEYCKVSDETKIKIGNIHRGVPMTSESRKKVSEGVKKLWEDPDYRARQTAQRHQKRGKYQEGSVKIKKRKQVNLEEFKKDYADFMHLDKMVEKYNISVHTVYRIIKRENISKRGYKSW